MANPILLTAGASLLNPPPSPPPSPPDSPLKPSLAVLVGVLTTMFSLTLLLLLYARRHCRRGTVVYSGDGGPPSVLSSGCGRRNSGIDRTIIESLPVFRFGSLSGQKDGLQCAVCLNRFDPDEVLRLLPKCNHAFHVECVDTWLEAHSTCPLCRIRVDPEDIILKLHQKLLITQQQQSSEEKEVISVRRVSGRHSSAGEGGTGLLQITIDPSISTAAEDKRRSLDGWYHHHQKKTRKAKKKNAAVAGGDSSAVAVGCLERHRKDGLLLPAEAERRSSDKRFEHRIVVWRGGAGQQKQRWSDVQPSDLLYLRSEMILSDSSRLSRSRPLDSSWKKQNGIFIAEGNNNSGWQGGRNVINSRSVSEITGLSRFGSSKRLMTSE